MIKVLFKTKISAPLNLKDIYFYVDTNNYATARKIAGKSLKNKLNPDYLKYYDKVLMIDIEVISCE